MSQFLTLADLSHLAARKLPDTPDGRYPYQVQAKATGATDESSQALHSKLTLLVDNVKSVVRQGPISNDPDQVFVRDTYTVPSMVLTYSRNRSFRRSPTRMTLMTGKASFVTLWQRCAKSHRPPLYLWKPIIRSSRCFTTHCRIRLRHILRPFLKLRHRSR